MRNVISKMKARAFPKLSQLAAPQPSSTERTAHPGEDNPSGTSQETAQETEVFLEAMRGVKPIKPTHRVVAPNVKPAPQPLQLRQRSSHTHSNTLIPGEGATFSDELDLATQLQGENQESASYRRQGIRTDTLRKLQRGHWPTQAALDLHGMRRDEARDALAVFLHACQQQNRRCVRVIHGKGYGSLNGLPVLKHYVRVWLVQAEMVMAFCSAKPEDGGTGALNVLLRAMR